MTSTVLPRVLGVLGGMGPLAGAAFVLRVVQLTPATADQDHIPVLLCNDPAVPDRSAARINGGPSPLPAMIRGLETLVAGKADCIAIPCNTAHLWFDELQACTSARLLHIVEAVIQDLRRQGVNEGRVGVLGTPATIAMGLYQKQLSLAGYESVLLPDHELQRLCVPGIAAVKGNQIEKAFAPVAESIKLLSRQGAKAVVLGCTELPLAVPAERRGEFTIPLTDSIEALARAAIAAMRPGCPPV